MVTQWFDVVDRREIIRHYISKDAKVIITAAHVFSLLYISIYILYLSCTYIVRKISKQRRDHPCMQWVMQNTL